MAATVFSAICCLASLLLLPLSHFLELPSFDSDGEVDLNGAVSIGSLSIAATRGHLWLFTGELPYTGSIISLEGSWDRVAAKEQRDWGWVHGRNGIEQVSYIDQSGSSVGKARYGDFPGIYYRYFDWRSSKTPWWTLAINFYWLIAVTSLLPSWWLIKRYGANLKYTTRTLLVAMTIIAIALAVAVTLEW